MSNLVTKTEFAKSIGVAGPYVTKLCNQKKLSLENDPDTGKQKINLIGSRTLEYLKRREIAQKEKPRQKPTYKPKPKPPQHAQPTTPPPDDQEDTSVYKLKDRNIQLKNKELEIKIAQKRGDLVGKELATSVFSRIFNIHENQFKAISVKSNPKIEQTYTDTYPDKAAQIIEALGRPTDDKIKTEILKILNHGESDRSRRMTEIMEDITGSILANIQIEIDRFLEMTLTTEKK